MNANAEKLKFGDKIENLWASTANPRRFAYFVRYGYRKGLVNGGKFIEVTDGKGSFWTFADDTKRAENVRKVADSPITD